MVKREYRNRKDLNSRETLAYEYMLDGLILKRIAKSTGGHGKPSNDSERRRYFKIGEVLVMKIIYDSRTGLGKQFAQTLGYPIADVTLSVNEPCLLITRNVGLGLVSKSTKNFLSQYHPFVIGVVVNGNKRFGKYYCKAGEKINQKYQLPIILNIEGAGNREDTDFVREYLKNRLEG